jgi:hypothetical protein
VFRLWSVGIVVAPVSTSSDNTRSNVVIATAHTNRGIQSAFMLIVAVTTTL